MPSSWAERGLSERQRATHLAVFFHWVPSCRAMLLLGCGQTEPSLPKHPLFFSLEDQEQTFLNEEKLPIYLPS